MKLLLAGEGRTELGDWVEHQSRRPGPGAPRVPGVLEALLERIAPESRWTVTDGVQWKSIKKFQAGNHRRPETRTVLGLALKAEEDGCDVLVFLRDRDADVARQRDVVAGIEEAREKFRPAIVGGVPIEAVEAWILAMLGEHGSENHRRPKVRLAEEHGRSGTQAIVEVIAAASLDTLPGDATSLKTWIALARSVLVQAT